MEKIMEERKRFSLTGPPKKTPPMPGTASSTSTRPVPSRTKAKQRLRMAENRDKVSSSPPEVEQVNLAENPDGPLDGWGFTADFTNEGEQAIRYLMIEIQYLNDAGKAVKQEHGRP